MFYSEIYPGRFYLELMDNGIVEQRKVNRALIEIAAKLSLPLVATNDCHYMKRQDAAAHDVLLCIQTGKTISDPGRIRMTTDEFYFKSPEEMARAFAEVPEAIDNTCRRRRAVLVCLYLRHLSVSRIPCSRRRRHQRVLRKRGRAGFFSPVGAGCSADRADAETGPTTLPRAARKGDRHHQEDGLCGLFPDRCRFHQLREKSCIPVGPGRGSAAGSLVAYSLGITDIDPLAYDLLFERFLNPERIIDARYRH